MSDRREVLILFNENRYLQLLAHTRLQHLQRIRGFTVRRQKRLSNPDEHQKEAFSRSFSFLNFAMLEASAIHSFSQALSSVSILHMLARLFSRASPPATLSEC